MPKKVTKKATAKKVKPEKYTHYHKDGSVYATGLMLGDKMEGYWEWFRKPDHPGGGDKSKMRSGYFKNGKQVGKWTTYDKDGKVVKVTHFK